MDSSSVPHHRLLISDISTLPKAPSRIIVKRFLLPETNEYNSDSRPEWEKLSSCIANANSGDLSEFKQKYSLAVDAVTKAKLSVERELDQAKLADLSLYRDGSPVATSRHDLAATKAIDDLNKFSKLRIRLPLEIQSSPDPKIPKKRVLVIGGGVSGLMTGWFLLENGYDVIIVSKEWAYLPTGGQRDAKREPLTSQIAGALWEFPPGGCGLQEIEVPVLVHSDQRLYEKWAMESYDFYQQMSNDPALSESFGVKMKMLHQFFFTNQEEELKFKQIKVLGIDARGHTQHFGFERPTISGFKAYATDTEVKELIDERKLGIDANYGNGGLKFAYSHEAPIIDTDQFMRALMNLLHEKGAEFESRAITGELAHQEHKLMDDYNVSAIVNATGLGAKDTASDAQVFPVRGAVRRLRNPQTSPHHIKDAVLLPAQKDKDEKVTKVVFIVPRNDDILVVGSIIQRNNWDLGLTVESPEIKSMWERANRFTSNLAGLEPDKEYPLAQGLRPFCHQNVRVESDMRGKSSRIVHNYGHGGSGWTLAVGCALTAVELVNMITNDKEPKYGRKANGEVQTKAVLPTRKERARL